MGKRIEADPDSPYQPGSVVARDLGIYLGQIYGWVKKGVVKNHLEGGYPEGKGILVEPNEVKLAWMSSKKKGPRAPRAPRASAGPKGRGAKSVEGEPSGGRGTRRLHSGDIVSYGMGQQATDATLHRPRYNIAQVLGSTGHLTYLDDGNHRVRADGVQLDSVVFTTERLSRMMAHGVARIERPVNVLGMLILAFVVEGKVELAQSLEDWMNENDLPVLVPELMDLEEEPEEESQLVGASDDED